MKSIKYFAFILTALLLSVHVFAQIKTYDAQWKKVDELISKKGLPKSALTEVKNIYAMAKKEKQDAQVIKSLIYMVRLQENTREDNLLQSIKEFEKEIVPGKEPNNSILKSLLASLYLRYLQENRWELYGRTNTINFNKTDIATWTVEDFHKKIGELYLQSISNKTILQKTKLEPFNAIVIKGNTRSLRPTLYDLLANQAIDYFESTERDLHKPAYAFEITQPEAFATADAFIKYKFTTRDTFSLHHKALLVYQELLAFHLNDAKPEALIDADINRIQFVYAASVAENKDSLYLNALDAVIRKYGNHAIAKQAHFLKASWYEREGSTYTPLGDTSNRYYLNKARDIVLNVVKDSSIKSEGWTNSYNLLQQLNRSAFSFKIEKVNLPSLPFRTLVSYKNVSSLHFRIIKADEKLKKALEARNEDDNFWSLLSQATPLKSWQQQLPATNDLQEHSVEVKIDALPLGEYYLLASADKQFNKKNTLLGARMFYVSNISFINQDDKFFVLHRESGQPLAKATTDLYQQTYDYKTYKYTRTKLGSYQTDANGFFKAAWKESERNVNYFVDIMHNGDRLNMDETLFRYFYSDYKEMTTPEIRKKIFFFTDRSIYRPGQTIHFKGIAISPDGKKNSIAVNYSTTIYLRNANYELTDSVRVISNEFGSFNGKFQLPQNVLNGTFYIIDKEQRNSTNFSVEDYKRPKFYVEFEKIQDSYKVNETVTITGNAKAYAGNNINGAKVSYRVVREPRFIYHWYFTKSWMPPVEEMEITNGELTTDENGKFIIRFTAIPDKKLDIKLDPVFDYKVYADVTDINGETRSNTTIVTAGYKSLLLKVTLPVRMPVDSFKKILIRTENMNGVYQPSNVSVVINKLTPENRLIRSRYWQQPDQFVMSKQEYIDYFPHDEYQNETDPKTWTKMGRAIERNDSTRMNSEFPMSGVSISPGYYEVEVSAKDKDGKEVKEVKIVELFDPASNQFNKPEYLWSRANDKPIELGDTTTIEIGTSANHVFVIKEVDKKIQTAVPEIPIGRKDRQPIPILEKNEVNNTGYTFVTLNNEKRSFPFGATEEDRGGYGVNFFFVKDNRFYQFIDNVYVPWTNKELKVEYATFRDKTLPGSEEKWTVKITGYKKEKVAAEMLASMYDASLDQFRGHEWKKPNIWHNYSPNKSWNGRVNFMESESMNKWVDDENVKSFEKEYDRLLGTYYDRYNMFFAPRAPTVESANRMDTNNMDLSRKLEGKVSGLVGDAHATSNEELSDQKSDENDVADDKSDQGNADIRIRKNFNETAFFFPDLRTDANGAIEFSFTAPEALTKWKLQTIAHTKELAFGINSKEIVTQKELMVQPNMPRFIRQGDHIELVVKIVNMSAKEFTGQAQLQLFDATTNQSVDGWFINSFPNQYFTVAAGQSEVVNFPIQVPYEFNNALTWRVVASTSRSAGDRDNVAVLSDGEENILPVLSNKILVTETMPLPVRGSETKNFVFEKLVQSGKSETLQHQSFTIEYTSNPAWYAVQALPYLMEYPYECAEQVWNRYYANALATKIANSSPRIKQIFEQWKTIDTSALLSNLEKNQELKSALLEETPWVLEAKTESEQKKNIALLFDMVRMSNELKSSLEKLKQMQSDNGGFVWFKGGPDDRYITQYIMTGIGHLAKLGVDISALGGIVEAGVPYLDRQLAEDYKQLIKSNANLKLQQISSIQIQYLYMRSFFPKSKIANATTSAFAFYQKQAKDFWMKQNKYLQVMTALALHRGNDKTTPVAILKSLKESSINHDELGMYWNDVRFGYSWFWSYAPIETQSLMIEAFSEITNDRNTVDDLRTWLIKNKQTNNWGTTKATAEACYAMLLQGTDWLTSEPVVQIKTGLTTVSNASQSSEAGTGYFKQTFAGKDVKPEMGNISVRVKQPVDQSTNQPANTPSWGAAYWQYFEDMDKVTTASTPLQLNKKLFIEKNTDHGPVLTPVGEATELKVGDKIKVRIELRVDRDMEYVHMKDMRASALEPVNVLSGYRWQGGLGYYESTRDASTNFFFNYLRKGTYVFEYSLFVSHSGTFSNGITTIQCMYAPEFSSHSEGVRINVE